jgi:hypothetical protein
MHSFSDPIARKAVPIAGRFACFYGERVPEGHAVAYDSTATSGVAFTGPRPSGRRSSRGPSVDDAIRELLEAADQGLVRDHRGHRLTAGAIRELHWYLAGHVSEALGRMRLGDVRRRHLEHLLCDLDDAGLPRRRLRSVVDSVRTLYDYAIERRLVEGNPADRVALTDVPATPQPGVGERRRTRVREWRTARPPRVGIKISDRVISLGLELATAGFALVAVVFLVGSLLR